MCLLGCFVTWEGKGSFIVKFWHRPCTPSHGRHRLFLQSFMWCRHTCEPDGGVQLLSEQLALLASGRRPRHLWFTHLNFRWGSILLHTNVEFVTLSAQQWATLIAKQVHSGWLALRWWQSSVVLMGINDFFRHKLALHVDHVWRFTDGAERWDRHAGRQ